MRRERRVPFCLRPQTAAFRAEARRGSVVCPVISLTPNPAPLDFGVVKVGTTSATLSVTVTNTGSTTITFPGGSSMAGSADFKYITDNCAPLLPGTSCVLSYAFSPTIAGAQTGANLLVFAGGLGSPLSINFTGMGM